MKDGSDKTATVILSGSEGPQPIASAELATMQQRARRRFVEPQTGWNYMFKSV
jgi:hypothetical protein